MSLEALIAPFLPKCSTPYHVLNISSTPKKSKKIFHSKATQTTIKTQHFITIFQNNTAIFGLEIFVYFILFADHTERLLFVSKADTTGLFDSSLTNGIEIKFGNITTEILRYLLNIPLSFYLEDVLVLNDKYEVSDVVSGMSRTQQSLNILANRWRANKDLKMPLESETPTYKRETFIAHPLLLNKICLFTRPEPQYLFPYSKKNSGKHLLTGDQLLKWWCKIIDSIASSEFQNAHLRLLIPGAESRTIQRYFPNQNWKVGEIFSNSNEDLAIDKIPLFPDDPKVRFIEHLIVENRIKKVKMKQFWIELSVRQEFRLGVVVGVVGVSGVLKDSNRITEVVNIVKLDMKSLKKIKLFITEEDYSQVDDLNSIENIFKFDTNLLVKIEGKGERSVKRSAEEVPMATTLQPMMVIKRKKKKTLSL